MNFEKFPSVFIISGEEMIYSTLEQAQSECADCQCIVEYKAVRVTNKELVRKYVTQDL